MQLARSFTKVATAPRAARAARASVRVMAYKITLKVIYALKGGFRAGDE